MSKFKNGLVYIIIDDLDITQEMVNYSTSTTKNNMPSKTVNLILKRILETNEPVNAVFANYTWYGQDEIMDVWNAL